MKQDMVIKTITDSPFDYALSNESTCSPSQSCETHPLKYSRWETTLKSEGAKWAKQLQTVIVLILTQHFPQQAPLAKSWNSFCPVNKISGKMEQFTLLGQFSRWNLQHLHHLRRNASTRYDHHRFYNMEGTIPSVCHNKKSPRCLEEQVKLLWGKNINTKVNLTIPNLASRMVLRKIQVCSRFPLVNIAAYKPHSIFRDT
jgi:hypothetical protein